MTKYYKLTCEVLIPTGEIQMSKHFAEEMFMRTLEEMFKGQRIKILNTVIVDEK
ncbi:MAG: hypothetical protein ACRD8W_03385 [Nitrososphaeraceae archaeon]